jgi:signal peptidase I
MGAATRGRQLLWSLLVPSALAAFEFRFLVPTRMSGAAGSLTHAIGAFSSENPLVVSLGLFIATSSAIHYWRERLYGAGVRARTVSRSRGRLMVALALAVVAAAFIRTSIAEVYRVSGFSMLPGIGSGDRLLVSKTAYGFKIPGVTARLGGQLPKRGDLIVFSSTDSATHATTALVKRVIGLPGDTIAFSRSTAVINNWPVPTCDAGPFVSVTKDGAIRGRVQVEFLENRAYLTVQALNTSGFEQYTVKKDEVFVAGDDRGFSTDSRAWNERGGGGVPIDDIRGKVTRVLVGGRPDGRLDASRILTRLGTDLHQPGVDASRTKEWIAGCLKSPPPSVPPSKPLDL